MDQNLILKGMNALKKGQSFAYATLVESTGKGTPRKAGSKMIVLENGTLFGSIGGGKNEKLAQNECLKSIKTGKSSLVTYDLKGKKDQSICGGQIKVFIEPLKGLKHLIICGAGHISLPLSIIGKMLQFKVSILDNRKDFANKSRFPHVDKIYCQEYQKSLKNLKYDKNTYIVIITHGHEFDFVCLKNTLKSDAGYIGVISSKTKRKIFLNQLKKLKIPLKIMRKLSIPTGLDIGAQTPEEIAISIASELIKISNKSLVGTEKFKEKLKGN